MRILYASQRPPYPFFLGGAARCAHRLLLALAQDHGAACASVGSAAFEGTPWSVPPATDYAALGVHSVSGPAAPGAASGTGAALECGYPVRLLADYPRALAHQLFAQRPDVVWAQLEGSREVLTLAREHGVKGLLYVHDAEDDPAQLRATADLGCHVVCSSAFLARKVEGVIGRPAHVVYPASDWYFGTMGDARGYVTMVNPHAVKGLDTFLEIARRMPGQRFLLQESWRLGDAALAALQARLASLPNVTFQHRVADMRQVYQRTRLLLVPSVWEEGFGMVAVEAQSCGIPVAASARGGLPESVGTGGLLVDDYRNVDAWMSALDTLLGNDAAHRHWSERALAHARSETFAPRQLARRFLDICRAPAPRIGVYARGLRTVKDGLGRVPVLGRLVQGVRR
jgi:glycosyltransferase involved in cell wall biosynthesis